MARLAHENRQTSSLIHLGPSVLFDSKSQLWFTCSAYFDIVQYSQKPFNVNITIEAATFTKAVLGFTNVTAAKYDFLVLAVNIRSSIFRRSQGEEGIVATRPYAVPIGSDYFDNLSPFPRR